MKTLYSVFFLLVFTIASAQVTLEQKLVVVQNTGVIGGAFRVGVMVKGTNLTAANTIGSATLDISFDNTKLSFPTTPALAAPKTRWPDGITSGAYGRSATNNTTFVRVLLTGGGVNGNFDGTPAGYDVLGAYDSLVTLTFTIVDNTGFTDLSILPGSNQIGLFVSHNNEDFSGTINDQTLTPPENMSGEPLPVELISLTATAKGRNVELAWETATEANSNKFEVERNNGKEWTKVSSVNASGTSNAPKKYVYVDRLKSAALGTMSYRLKMIDNDGKFAYSQIAEVKIVPTVYALEQNYPNPFNPETKIQYSLPTDAKVTLKLYDMVGREVATVVNEQQTAGYYEQKFGSYNYSSGIYFYRIVAESGGKAVFTGVKKMVMIK